MSYQYVYLIQTREFVNSKEPIYKIGKTTKINFTRFLQYPKDSVQIFQSSCYDCDVLEKNIIKRFHAKYHHCKLIGREYFKGNVRHMVNDICQLILLEKQEDTTESFAHGNVTDIIHDISSNVLDNAPNESGVEPIIAPTSEILVQPIEVSVELEPTESDTIHHIIRNVLDDVPKDIRVQPIIRQNLVINLEPKTTIPQYPVISVDPIEKLKKFKCDVCEFSTDNNSCLEAHLLTNTMNERKGSQFCCTTCKYFTYVKSNLQKHLKSKKHALKETPPIIDPSNPPNFQCKLCNKCYKTQSGIWKHSQICNIAVRTYMRNFSKNP